MNQSDDRRKAGIFLLGSLALLLVIVGILAGVRFLKREKVYIAEFRESVAGLEVSSPVKYNGVPVGQVSAIRFHPTDIERIQVEFKVGPEIPIELTTRAQLAPQGITGIFYLELSGGRTEDADLEEGSPIPSDPSLSTKINAIAGNLSDLLARLNDFVKKNEANLTYAIEDFRASAGSIRATLEKVDRAVGKGEQTMDEALRTVEDLRAEVKATGASVRHAVSEAEAFLQDKDLRAIPGKANRTLDMVNDKLASADFRGLLEKAGLAVDEFRKIEANLDRATETLAAAADDGRRDVSAALSNIRTASEHVKEATRLLKEDPGRLLRSAPESEKAIPDPLRPLPEDRR